jgi:hypothetical protein
MWTNISQTLAEKPPKNGGVRKVNSLSQWRSQPENLVMLCKYFRLYRP